VILQLERYPYVDLHAGSRSSSPAPFLPVTLRGKGSGSVSTLGLLDRGAGVNVLPYHMSVELGAIWEEQRVVVPLSGNLAVFEARGLLLSAQIGPFPTVRLAFAWAITDAVPLLLGQQNFFLLFDVCFHRSRLFFEISSSIDPSSMNP
jgi:hypothetical protein